MSEKTRPQKRSHSFIKTTATILLFSAMTGCLALVYVLMQFGSYDAEKLHNDPTTTLLYDKDGKLALSAYGAQNRIPIGIEEMPKRLRDAFLAAEDLRFYQHTGFDVVRIFGALWADIQAGNLSQGGSTITQQLIKNTHLTPDKTWMRKLQEAYFAYQVEQDYSKEQILAMYMNHVYLGNGAYGVQAAAKAYFGVDARDLNLRQSAAIAAILKAPSNYSPHIKPENNKRRRDAILATMREENMITALEADEAVSGNLAVIDREREMSHGWYTDAALQEAAECLGIGMDELLSGGYRIHTAMNSELQEGMEQLFAEESLFPMDTADGTSAQAALLALETQTGAISAMVGGREYTTRMGLNRATQARRQPGSTLKPFAVYAPAIERIGLTAATFLDDSPIDIGGYAPGNYGGKFSGWITARTALARSLNIPAVLILDEMGIEAAREGCTAFRIPLEDEDRYLPIALGSMVQGVSPLELCSAYATLGNGGVYHEPYTISRIEDMNGKQIYAVQKEEHRAVDKRTAYLLTNMLQSTVTWGTGTRIAQAGITAAAKTGTVAFEGEQNRDAWTVAYTPNVSIVAWMGFDVTDAEHALPTEITGGSLPAGLAARTLSLAQKEDIPFSAPGGIVHVQLEKRALEMEHIALLATEWTPPEDTIWETYIEGTAPTQYSGYWTPPSPPTDLRIEEGPGNLPVIRFTALNDKVRYRLYRINGGEDAAELTVFEGGGGILEYVDSSVERGQSYLYFVTAEHAEAADRGITNAVGKPSTMVGFVVPLLPFDFPFDLDDLFLMPTDEPIPTTVADRIRIAEDEPTGVGEGQNRSSQIPTKDILLQTPVTSPTTFSPLPMSTPLPRADEPLILYLP